MKRTGEHARALEELEGGEAHAPPARATPAGDVLALQRSAGNRAVAALLARDATKPKEEKTPQGTGPRVIFPGIGEIPVESFQLAGMRSVPRRGSREEPEEKLPKEILFTSKVGEHSDALMRAMVQGDVRNVEVILPQGSRLKLKGAIVASYNVSSGGDQPTESWSLSFESMEFEHEGAKEEEE